MTFDSVEAELAAAIAADNPDANPGFAQPPAAAEAEAALATSEQAAPEATPEGIPADEVQPLADTFDGGKFNPDELPLELQPGWKQLQADYTRKMQELSEQRKVLEGLPSSNPEEIATALQTLEWINDERNWPTLYERLQEQLAERGLTQREQPAPAGPSVPQGSPLERFKDDPELAPLVEYVQSLESKVTGLDQAAQQRAAAEQAQREQQALQARIEAQRAEIAAANKAYQKDDLDFITELSPFYGADLNAAQARAETWFQARLGRYLSAKQAAANEVLPDKPTLIPQGEAKPDTALTADQKFEAAHKAALASIEAAEGLDF